MAFAQDSTAPTQSDASQLSAPSRPQILFNRWQEDWSVLADPTLRTEPLDDLKYIPLSSGDPESYISLGANLRERVESTEVNPFGVGDKRSNTYLLQRLEVHADVRPNEHWQIFGQLEDDRALDKIKITPVDTDPLDLAQAFVAYTNTLAGGVLKVRAGRQEMAFDLQRFVSVRDGPNVRQAFDALWLDWEKGSWRFISFWSHPVQPQHEHPFDDSSSHHFQYGGFRVERKHVGPGELSAYFSRYDLDGAQYLDASGNERRNIFDVRYGLVVNHIDWDLEVMDQSGHVGDKTVRAWAAGSRSGYTFADIPWTPRVGIQLDVASGDRHPGSNTLGTFNPLFPNGYYFTLAGDATYANLIHVKPSIQVVPVRGLSVLAAIGLQWRETTADAVYVTPDIPVPGTAGEPGAWTGIYGQLRVDWTITPNLAAAVEAVQYGVGDAIRRAGGLNASYLGVELRFGW